MPLQRRPTASLNNHAPDRRGADSILGDRVRRRKTAPAGTFEEDNGSREDPEV
jgi:hypothetical protein